MLYGSVGRVGLRALLGTTFSPLSLFASGEQGLWYQNSDFSTLFQDAAGTTPVTALEQPVGLRLDKSKGLALGSELVTNGDFSNGTTGWILSGATSTVVNGQIEMITSAGSRPVIAQDITTVVGKTYQITFQFQIVSGGVMNARVIRADLATDIIASNTGRGVFTALDTTTRVYIRNNNTTNGSGLIVDNISVRELTGNHAFQTTNSARPVLSARVNLLTQTEDFSNAAWLKSTTPAPILTNMGSGVWRLQASAGSWLLYQRVAGMGSVNATFSIEVKSNGAGLDTFRFMLAGVAVGSNVTATSSWVRYSATSVNNGSGDAGIIFSSGSDAIDILIRFPDLRAASESSALPAYQRVGAATYGSSTAAGTPDYDTVGFPPYLVYDGGDWMQTNSINFGAGATNPPLVGPELVTNGDFSGGASGWTAQAGATFTVTGGVASVSGNVGYVGQSFTTVVGRFYSVTATLKASPALSAFGGIRKADDAINTVNVVNIATSTSPTSVDQTNTVFFFATATTTWINIQANNYGTVNADNITVKEVNQLYAPDKMSVFAGVRKLADVSGSGFATIAELSSDAGVNNGVFGVYGSNTFASPPSFYQFNSKGTVEAVANVQDGPYAAPVTNVLSGLGNISGDSCIIRLNSIVLETTTSDQGSGTFGNYPIYFGSRNGSTSFFTGRDYGFVIVGRAVNAAELAGTENYMDIQTFGRDMILVYSDELTTATGDLITAADGDQIYMTVAYQ